MIVRHSWYGRAVPSRSLHVLNRRGMFGEMGVIQATTPCETETEHTRCLRLTTKTVGHKLGWAVPHQRPADCTFSASAESQPRFGLRGGVRYLHVISIGLDRLECLPTFAFVEVKDHRRYVGLYRQRQLVEGKFDDIGFPSIAVITTSCLGIGHGVSVMGYQWEERHLAPAYFCKQY